MGPGAQEPLDLLQECLPVLQQQEMAGFGYRQQLGGSKGVHMLTGHILMGMVAVTAKSQDGKASRCQAIETVWRPGDCGHNIRD
jgi:hypothetical protein